MCGQNKYKYDNPGINKSRRGIASQVNKCLRAQMKRVKVS